MKAMAKTEAKHPVQPLVVDPSGVTRFKKNEIVELLLERGPLDMNALAQLSFSREDREQFAQLIGYSLGGFSELSYVSDDTHERASRQPRHAWPPEPPKRPAGYDMATGRGTYDDE